MSSTTDRRSGSRGQVLPLFAGGLIAILAVAALVFDVGMNLFERRQYQDSADAAALAGARYLTESSCLSAPSLGNCGNAVSAAVGLAVMNTAGPGGTATSAGPGAWNLVPSGGGSAVAVLTVHVPPISGDFRGQRGYIQTDIASTRPSFFAGVLGMTAFDVGAGAVASRLDNYALPYSFLALDDSNHCGTGQIGGNGTITVTGDVMVNSSCSTSAYALAVNGSPASITAPTCSANGTMDPSVTLHCTHIVGVPQISDPLLSLPAPVPGSSVVPDPPTAPDRLSGTVLPASFHPCPGGTPTDATRLLPKTCGIKATAAGTVVRVYPGVYWGGLQFSATGSDTLTVYMEPGIYYMAGGGFVVAGDNVTVLTTVHGGTTFDPSAANSGVMIYNDDDPEYRSGCVAGTDVGDKCIRAVNFSNTTAIKMNAYGGSIWTHILIFQARNASGQPAFTISGNTANEFYGTIYMPKATFTYSGNGSGEYLGAQVIAWDFAVSGNGSLSITYDPSYAVHVRNVGLVQ